MCGIAGIIGSNKEEEIKLLLESIRTRGDKIPTYKTIGNAILGSALLEILDSSSGSQPIFNGEKTKAIVFNGEIYNYKELKDELINKGYTFKTDTDTEVLLYLFEEYEEKMLNYLDGMFAFVICDSTNEDYFGARDHFGIKPFFYTFVKSTFYFSSELKSFSKIKTDELLELPPGSFIRDGKVSKYYTIRSKRDEKVIFADAKIEVEKLVEKAVRKRIDTNDPIIVFFSGGVDSSIILYLANKYHKNVTAIIIGHDNSEDVFYARKFCNDFKYDFHQIDFNENDLLEAIPNVIHIIESFEPNPVRGSTLSYLISKHAHKLGYKIALCGEGSDEIFAGYGDFLDIEDKNEFKRYSINLTKDLYRTQLLRVDKTSMAFSLEVRVPFLDVALVEYAINLPKEFKINKISNVLVTKYILREAFKDMLPDYIYKRKKMTLMMGTGAGKVNSRTGIFYEHACKRISDEEYLEIQNGYPGSSPFLWRKIVTNFLH